MIILNCLEAQLFNHRASATKYKPNEIINALEIKKGNVIVDIGSGNGYYTIQFAKKIGLEGKVYAVDINKAFLQYIDSQAKDSGLTNITTVLINENVKGIPEKSADLIFFRNVYHHIHEPEKYFKEIKKFLKPHGRIAIIDYKKTNRFSIPNLIGHFVKEEDVIATLNKADFTRICSFDFLAEQSFNIFQINHK